MPSKSIKPVSRTLAVHHQALQGSPGWEAGSLKGLRDCGIVGCVSQMHCPAASPRYRPPTASSLCPLEGLSQQQITSLQWLSVQWKPQYWQPWNKASQALSRNKPVSCIAVVSTHGVPSKLAWRRGWQRLYPLFTMPQSCKGWTSAKNPTSFVSQEWSLRQKAA